MSKVIRKVVNSARAPKPVGPYSQAVVVNGTMYVSGTLGLQSDGDLVKGDVVAEATQCLNNLKAVVEDGGSDLTKVVKTTVLLKDINDWPAVNNIYTKFFKEPYPARAAYQVAALPKNAKVEIEAIAVLGDVQDQ